jgi:flagellar motility protein MotE (MotC chaperone)
VKKGYNPVIKDGVAFVQFAYDVGMAIGLDAAEKSVNASTERAPIPHQRRAPKYFEFQPYPLRVTRASEPLTIGAWKTLPTVETTVFDFGAVSVTYQIPLSGEFAALARLSELLYDNTALLADSRRLVEELVRTISPSISRPLMSSFYEDYVIFQIRELEDHGAHARLLAEAPTLVAQVLRADEDLRSEQEVVDALSVQVSYGSDDLTLVDWVSSIIFAATADDTRAVLEFATVQLLELRHLDAQLDSALERYYDALTRSPKGPVSLFTKADDELREIGQLQVESALLFENINNAIKLLGDQYLARLYQQAARRYHLTSWDKSIQRKLKTLESIYSKMDSALSAARLEFLEWIVIILIGLELVVPFLTGRR